MGSESNKDDWSKPDASVPAYKTFLSLLMARPVGLSFRFNSAPHFSLWSKPLTSVEYCQAIEIADDNCSRDSDLRPVYLTACIATKSLVDANGTYYFSNPSTLVDYLDQSEYLQFASSFCSAFWRNSPMYCFSDVDEWSKYLKQAFKAPETSHLAFTAGMAAAKNSGFGESSTFDRPDIFFGKPLIELTDGQMIAYRACKEHVDSFRRKTHTV